MRDKGIAIHLLIRLAVFVIPEALLLLYCFFTKHVIIVAGVAHVTDGALGGAIFTFVFLTCWGIYLIVDMLLLFKKSEKTKARTNLYLLAAVITGAAALLINL